MIPLANRENTPFTSEEATGEDITGDYEILNPDALFPEAQFTTLSPTQSWQPQLENIQEENYKEMRLIRRFNDDGIRRHHRRARDRYKKLEDKIQANMKVNKGGIYRLQLDTVSAQHDNGANRSVTNNRNLLVGRKIITPYHMNGVNGGITCTEKGYIPWYSDNDQLIMVPCYYTPQVRGTIISPTDIVDYNKVIMNQHHRKNWAVGGITIVLDSHNSV